MKKMFLYALIFMLVSQAFSIVWGSGEAHAACSPEGDGTAECPFVIMDAAGLSDIRIDLSAHYRLGANIDLAGYDYDGAGPDAGGWMPIGAMDDNTGNLFTGTLDGNGYVIRNLTIDRPSMSFVGLIGRIGSSGNQGQLLNIRLIDVQIRGKEAVGAVSGNLIAGKIESSYATGKVDALQSNAGGLVGTVTGQGSIFDSYAVVNVGGWIRVGGLAGMNAGTIRNSFAAGSIKASGGEAGGLTGYASSTSIVKDSYALGSIISDSGSIGGLIGRGDGGSSAPRSYWNKDTTGWTNSAGGTGMTTEEMKESGPFADWDPTVWGFRPGELYPYLRAFGMGIAVDPLAATTYSLHPGQDTLSVTGSLFHETEGEPIAVKYDVRDTSNFSVISATYGAILDGGSAIPLNRKFSLSGLSDGDYTITVTAEDSRNTTVGGMLAFKVDTTSPPPPSIDFGTNGSEAWVYNASTSVTVSDSGGGIDSSTLQYVWSTDPVAPFSDWNLFSNGQTLSKSGVEGEWYLHIRAKDGTGNPANATTNRFRMNASSAVLSGLALSAGELDPAFVGSTFNYAASVAAGIFEVTATPVAANAGDTIEASVNDGEPLTVASGSPSGRFALREGTNALRIVVTALNGAQNFYNVSLYRTPSSSSSSSSSSSGMAVAPDTGKNPVAMDADGGVIVTVDADRIKKVAKPKGDFSERVDLDQSTLNAALDLLRQAPKPKLTIAASDSEREIRVQLPAEWLARTDAAVPHAVIEVRLNASSFRFVVGELDLQGLAAQLGAEVKDLNVNVTMERITGQMGQELGRAASASGAQLIGNAVAYRISAESAVGHGTNFGDSGIMDTVRAIVLEENSRLESWTAVRYDSVARTISFVPAKLALRPDGKREIAMSAPQDGIYAVLATSAGFVDLDGHWAKKDIELLASKLIVRGLSDRRFAPDADVTRAEFVALLVRGLGLPASLDGGNSQFSDVPTGAWYATFVEAAANTGLVSGTAQGRFAPDERITREQMTVMIAKALSVAGGQEDAANLGSAGREAFPDKDAISPWAQASVAQMAAAGLVSGMPDGTFAPSETATRAQAVVLLKRLLRHVRIIE
ncbi:S-layer homology domain-containing protein [Cohnella phaseoli]|uniref:Cadherin-like protein n=1 Tax=Cohnella phaseoli TaxID=456490 RepID=A0A3D9IXG2_9BACL|nr:S-layer homology domain-containing protein [Cohnella phaseoli]RED66533.1 cadherin-like protein [Cohnella phaseoli]